MAHYRRLKVPDVKKGASDTLLALREVAGGKQVEESTLSALYGTKSFADACRALMFDLLYEASTNAAEAPTSAHLQRVVLTEYKTLTGLSDNTARSHFNKASSMVTRVANIGLMTNYAMAVKTDIIEKAYKELIDKETGELKESMRVSDKIRIMQLIVDTATSVTEVGLKQENNVINARKNDILERKVDNEGNLLKEVTLQIQGKDKAEKEKMLIDALFTDKTLLNPVIDKLISSDENSV